MEAPARLLGETPNTTSSACRVGRLGQQKEKGLLSVHVLLQLPHDVIRCSVGRTKSQMRPFCGAGQKGTADPVQSLQLALWRTGERERTRMRIPAGSGRTLGPRGCGTGDELQMGVLSPTRQADIP